MHTYVLTAEVIVPDSLTSFVKEEFPLTWDAQTALLPFNFGDQLRDKVPELLHRDMFVVAGDREDFVLGDSFKVAEGTYEFWFSYRDMDDSEEELDVVEAMEGAEDRARRLYIAGVEKDDSIGRFIKTAALERRTIDIETEELPLEDWWVGTFKIVLTVKKKR